MAPAGRSLQDLPRIDAAIADGDFFDNAALLGRRAARGAGSPAAPRSACSGPGGVHSVDRHAVAIARLARQHGASDVVVHGLLDGRDTPPRSADGFVPDFEARLREAHPDARIATHRRPLLGAWIATSAGSASSAATTRSSTAEGLRRRARSQAVLDGYARDENDEFIQPTVIGGVDGTVRDGDVVVHFNFRADRARQLIHALRRRRRLRPTCFDRGAAAARPASS